jgi:CheY-like chemotaxis protein
VLVIDDNATNRQILAETVASWGMRPTAVDGAGPAMEALVKASEAGSAFPLVLLDAMMPEVDGFTLAGRIRRHPALAQTVVVMLSSASQAPELHAELGIAACLIKPAKQSELLEAIQSALRLSPAEEPASPPPPAPGMPPLRVLLVEDNPVNQRLAVRLLEKQGHAVHVVATGEDAVEAAALGPFDVVLMDVQMPGMDGLEATRRIRERERQSGGHVPIVGLTAHAMKGDRERCLEAGMDAYVAKPIQLAELWNALAGIMPWRPGGAV